MAEHVFQSCGARCWVINESEHEMARWGTIRGLPYGQLINDLFRKWQLALTSCQTVAFRADVGGCEMGGVRYCGITRSV